MASIMDFFSPADLPGHLSYVLIAISYYATNIYWLRVTAVIGLALEILYFQLSHGAMHTGIVWNLVFILINIYQLHVLLRERIQLRHVTDLALLRQGVFATLGNAQLARLVQAGEWRNIPADTALTQQGQPVAELVLLCEGSARVEVDGVVHRAAAGRYLLRRNGIYFRSIRFRHRYCAAARTRLRFRHGEAETARTTR